MVVPGQRKTARLAAEQEVRYLAHLNTCRLRGGASNGPAQENGRAAERASADVHPPAVGQGIATPPGHTRCRLREISRCLNQPHAHGLKTRSYRISMPHITWPAG